MRLFLLSPSRQKRRGLQSYVLVSGAYPELYPIPYPALPATVSIVPDTRHRRAATTRRSKPRPRAATMIRMTPRKAETTGAYPPHFCLRMSSYSHPIKHALYTPREPNTHSAKMQFKSKLPLSSSPPPLHCPSSSRPIPLS